MVVKSNPALSDIGLVFLLNGFKEDSRHTCKRETGDGRLVMGDETRDDTTVQGLAIYQTKLKMVFC